MAYITIDDFRGGLDLRRESVAGVPGTARQLLNAHINQGGEIERRKEFVRVITLPSGTVGLVGTRGLNVFGMDAEPVGMSNRVNYVQLTGSNLTGSGLRRILSSTTFRGVTYVVAELGDGDIQHFYNGDLVTDWREDGLQLGASSNDNVASRLATKINLFGEGGWSARAASGVVTIVGRPGVAFTLVAQNGGTAATTQSAAASVAEVRAHADINITAGSTSSTVNRIIQVTINGTQLLDDAVVFYKTRTATEILLVDRINRATYRHGYYAEHASGAVCRIFAPAKAGASANAYAMSVSVGGDVTVTADSTMSGGANVTPSVPQISTFTVTGSFSTSTRYWLTIDGQPFRCHPTNDGGVASAVATHNGKVYAFSRSDMIFSGYGSAIQWPYTGHAYSTGPGIVTLSEQDGGLMFACAAALYRNALAVLSDTSIQVWELDPDPANNRRLQFVSNTGTSAPGSVISFGSDDVFYLARSGIRSLAARDSSGLIGVSDIGSPIDPLLAKDMRGMQQSEIAKARSLIEPETGNYWLCLGRKIYVLSYYPKQKISAWSTYEVDFDIEEVAVVGRRVWIRSGNDLYLYGGNNDATYPAKGQSPVIVELPFLHGGRPANKKQITGVDGGLVNTWRFELLLDPNDPANKKKRIDFGLLSQTTYNFEDAAGFAHATHVAPRLTCTEAGPAKIINLAIHYDGDALPPE